MYEKNGGNPRSFDVRMVYKVWPRLMKIMRQPTPGTVKQARKILRDKVGMQKEYQINRMLIGMYLTEYNFLLVECAEARDPGSWGAEIETSFQSGEGTILLKVLTRNSLPAGFFKGRTPPVVRIAGVSRGNYGFQQISADDFHDHVFGRKGLTLFFQVTLHLTGANGTKRTSDGVIMLTEYGDTAQPDSLMNRHFPGLAAMWAPIGVRVRDLLDSLDRIED